VTRMTERDPEPTRADASADLGPRSEWRGFSDRASAEIGDHVQRIISFDSVSGRA
jgi:hypothetical protein